MDEPQKSNSNQDNTIICPFEPPHRQHLRRKWQILETRLRPNGNLTEKKKYESILLDWSKQGLLSGCAQINQKIIWLLGGRSKS